MVLRRAPHLHQQNYPHCVQEISMTQTQCCEHCGGDIAIRTIRNPSGCRHPHPLTKHQRFMIRRSFKVRKPTRIARKRPKRGSRRTKRRGVGKDKVWTMKRADKAFSVEIRNRDKRCMHPQGTEYCKLLQNSHFIGRATKSTRYDPDNCIAICWYHHYKSKD